MEGVGHGAGSGNLEGDRVGPGRGYIDGIVEPLAAGRPAKIVAAARGRGCFQIDAVGTVAVIRPIDRADVVGTPLTAGVVVLSQNRARDGGRRSAVGRSTPY